MLLIKIICGIAVRPCLLRKVHRICKLRATNLQFLVQNSDNPSFSFGTVC